jgi:N-methylhydantoinase A/oxoprolinase/acetone carboxylase beta subunit
MSPADVTLFAYGGNGALFAAPVAERLGIPEARVFGLGPVLAAFGSSVSDVVHVYERSVGGGATAEAAEESLRAAAVRDLEAEGFDPAAATIDVELERAGNGDGSGDVELVRVRARYPVGVYEPAARPARDAGAAPTPLTERVLKLGGEPAAAPVHDWDALAGGGAVDGPALAVGETMSCLVPPGWRLEVDEFANGTLRSRGKA